MREVFIMGNSAFLPGSKTAVVTLNKTYDAGFIEDGVDTPIEVTPASGSEDGVPKEVEFMPFGSNNNLPLEIMKKIGDNTIVGSNVEFKANLACGAGLVVGKKEQTEGGKMEFRELSRSDVPAVFEFLENCNYSRVMQEIANDMVVFGDSFVQLCLGRSADDEVSGVATLLHREMCFSRVSKQDEKTRKILYHGYSSLFGKEASPEDVVVTPLLSRKNPLYDLRVRQGILPSPETGETVCEKAANYVMSLNLPVPGRYYYNRPYWWSIFLDWYEFSCAIPKFKKALIQNQMVLKYHVSVNSGFYAKLYKSQGIPDSDPKKQAAAKKKFLQNLDEFLSGAENAGKSFVSAFDYDKVNKYQVDDIVIKPIESFIKGGEYIEDSEEATNVICNTMGVHPSLKGASPGKSKNINGTEARELFIIAQVLFTPIREMMVLPLYLVKELNGWDKALEFRVSNMMLTTLDKGTGSVKVIS